MANRHGDEATSPQVAEVDGIVNNQGKESEPVTASLDVMPVEVVLAYTYPEPFGLADVTYVVPAGKTYVKANGQPISNDEIQPGMRIRLHEGVIATITGVKLTYQPPDPPVLSNNGQWLSRVIGTIKHKGVAVLDVKWQGYTATGSPDHRYYSVSRQRYVPARELTIGEFLRGSDGLPVRVLGVSEPRYGAFELYNVEVEHFHNYFVGSGGNSSVLVHNGTGQYINNPEEMPEEQALEIARNIAKKYGNLECDACAREIAKTLGKDFKATFERLRTQDGSDPILHVESGEMISRNKVHIGVRIGETIIDNVHPQGVPARSWVGRFCSATSAALVQKSSAIANFFGKVFLLRQFKTWFSSPD